MILNKKCKQLLQSIVARQVLKTPKMAKYNKKRGIIYENEFKRSFSSSIGR